MIAGDENRLVGYTALPVNINPATEMGGVEPVVGAALPAPGSDHFASSTLPPAPGRGKFHISRLVNDVTPPSRASADRARYSARDSAPRRRTGAPASTPAPIVPKIDGRNRSFTFRRGIVTISGVTPGRHRIT